MSTCEHLDTRSQRMTFAELQDCNDAPICAIANHATAARGVLCSQVAALVTFPATLKRSARLSSEASSRSERLARVVALAHKH